MKKKKPQPIRRAELNEREIIAGLVLLIALSDGMLYIKDNNKFIKLHSSNSARSLGKKLSELFKNGNSKRNKK